MLCSLPLPTPILSRGELAYSRALAMWGPERMAALASYGDHTSSLLLSRVLDRVRDDIKGCINRAMQPDGDSPSGSTSGSVAPPEYHKALVDLLLALQVTNQPTNPCLPTYLPAATQRSV